MSEWCLSAYFSKHREINKKFKGYSDDLLKAAVKIRSSSSKTVASDSTVKEFYSIVQQTRLMRIEHFGKQKNLKSKAMEVKAFVKEYENSKRTRFSPFVPTQFPQTAPTTIMKLHIEHIEPVIRKLKKLEKDSVLEKKDSQQKGL